MIPRKPGRPSRRKPFFEPKPGTPRQGLLFPIGGEPVKGTPRPNYRREFVNADTAGAHSMRFTLDGKKIAEITFGREMLKVRGTSTLRWNLGFMHTTDINVRVYNILIRSLIRQAKMNKVGELRFTMDEDDYRQQYNLVNILKKNNFDATTDNRGGHTREDIMHVFTRKIN